MRRSRTWLDWLPVRRFMIAETSMQPTLQPRDRILVWRWTAVRPGDVVVFSQPDQSLRVTVKRVRAVLDDGAVLVAGDNPNVSTDSRHFGVVPRRNVIGRAVFRYLPGSRRGRL